MRRNLLFLMVVAAFITAPVMAELTVEQTTDAEHLINNGYSEAMAEDVFMVKNRATGQSIEPLYERSSNIFARSWRKFYSYLDPAQSEEDRLHHDVKLSPSFTDL